MRQTAIKKLDSNSILNLCVNQVIIDLATCVKELVENALDAKSSKIEIILREYGKEGIEVIDNGSGIDSENLENIAQQGATKSVARERGTTITLRELFGSFPVRKQEFNKNIMGQFNKLVNLLTEYALISSNCQICLVNMTAKKGREMILNSGQPTKTIIEKVTIVLSKKIADLLVECRFAFGEDSRVSEGYVLGRVESGSTTESRQISKNMTFLYANNRPINPFKKMTPIFNEIYRKYNSSARYIYILNMQVKKDSLDFNLSPDKRDIYLKYEPEFLIALRESLIGLFERLGAQTKVLQPSAKGNKKALEFERDEGEVQQKVQLKEQIGLNNSATPVKPKLSQEKHGEDESSSKSTSSFMLNDFNMELMSVASSSQSSSKQIQLKSSSNVNFKMPSTSASDYFELAKERKKAMKELQAMTKQEEENEERTVQFSSSERMEPENSSFSLAGSGSQMQDSPRYKNGQSAALLQTINAPLATSSQNTQNCLFIRSRGNDFATQVFGEHNYFGGALFDKNRIEPKPTIVSGIMERLFKSKNEQSCEKQDIQGVQESQIAQKELKIEEGAMDEFSAELDEGSEKKNVHGTEFKKESFADLVVLGQFNKAFVLAYWPIYNEIFLIDQHASDEKINFERLLRENVFHSQLLVNPIQLPLTPQEEDILNTHKEVFKRNGFQFIITKQKSDQSAILQVNQLPVSKHIQFDINDFDEIFSNLCSEESDPETLRPTKIQKILASKACRSSIMVGTALAPLQMKQLLSNLALLHSPWNCPHGRPTMVKTPHFATLAAQISTKKNYSL